MLFRSIILVILIVLVVYNLFTNNGIRTDVAMYNHKIDSIQKEIDSVQIVNKQLDAHINQVDNEFKTVETQVTTINKDITVIKTQTHEKVESVNNYTIHDLLKFFSDRYESGRSNQNGLDSTSKSTDSKVSH